MTSFAISTWEERPHGLMIGLCPGRYMGKPSQASAIFIAEDAFALIEPVVRNHSAAFGRSYGHWGITEIPRTEWGLILSDLKRLRSELEIAPGSAAESSPIIETDPLPGTFSDNLSQNRPEASAMICDLNRWIEQMLMIHDTISVLGI